MRRKIKGPLVNMLDSFTDALDKKLVTDA